jgi:hypothetical protein
MNSAKSSLSIAHAVATLPEFRPVLGMRFFIHQDFTNIIGEGVIESIDPVLGPMHNGSAIKNWVPNISDNFTFERCIKHLLEATYAT